MPLRRKWKSAIWRDGELWLIAVESIVAYYLLSRFTSLTILWSAILALPIGFIFGRFAVLLIVGLLGIIGHTTYVVLETAVIRNRRHKWVRPLYKRCYERAKRHTIPEVKKQGRKIVGEG